MPKLDILVLEQQVQLELAGPVGRTGCRIVSVEQLRLLINLTHELAQELEALQDKHLDYPELPEEKDPLHTYREATTLHDPSNCSRCIISDNVEQ